MHEESTIPRGIAGQMPAIASRTRMCMPAPWWSSSWAALLAAGLIVAATVAAFSNSFAGPFVFDDTASIPENPAIRHLWPLSTAAVSAPRRRDRRGPAALEPLPRDQLRPWRLGRAGLSRRQSGNPSCLCPAVVWDRAADPAAAGDARLASPPQPRRWGWPLPPLGRPSAANRVGDLSCSASGVLGRILLSAGDLRADPRRGTRDPEARGKRQEAKGVRLEPIASLPIASSPTAWYVLTFLACLLGMATKEVMVSAAEILAILRSRVSRPAPSARRGGGGAACTWRWPPRGCPWAGWFWGTATSVGIGRGASWWAYFCTQCAAIVHYLRLCAWPHPLVFDYGDRLCQGFWEVLRRRARLGRARRRHGLGPLAMAEGRPAGAVVLRGSCARPRASCPLA